MINYYKNMYAQRTRILRPLASIVGTKSKWTWQAEQQAAFNEIKQAMARETILSFTDYTANFDVYTNASDYQMGGVVTQNKRPLVFFSRKFNIAQSKYTTTEQELLGIVENFKTIQNDAARPARHRLHRPH